MKEKLAQFIKDFILMAIIISIMELIFYKLNIINELSIPYTIGFMIGWSIWQLFKMFIDNRKQK